MNFKQFKLELDLLKYQDRLITKREGDKTYIKDIVRKKYLVMLPEEWVRQLIIHYLLDEAKIPIAKIQVEKQIMINGLQRRFDILIYDNEIMPQLIVECKSPQVAITQQVFDQVAAYNQSLNAPYMVITNGLHTYICKIDKEKTRYVFLTKIPPL